MTPDHPLSASASPSNSESASSSQFHELSDEARSDAPDGGAIANRSQISEPPSLTHLDASGQAQMVDVSSKTQTVRRAIATASVRMQQSTFDAIQSGNAPKGDVLGTARLAGIMAAKQTPQLIPLCHAIPIQKVSVDITPHPDFPGYRIEAEVKTKAETGVEMEALTAVSVAALTLYDMAKGLEKSIQIEDIHLLRKTGGKSGDYQHHDTPS